MAGTRAAQRYAKALLGLAKDKNIAKEVNEEMRLISNTLKQSRELQNVLKSPVIKTSVKRASLKAIFKDVNEITTSLFDILVDNNRIDILGKVTQSFIALFDEMNNVKVAHVTTAAALTPEMEAKVLVKVQELTGSKASIINKVDKSILGGFILRIGDLQYDASISGRLENLSKKFKNNTYVKV